MSKAAFEAKLAAVEALKERPSGPERDAALAKALGDRNNYVVAKASHIVGEARAQTLIPRLLEAFERFMENPGKTDPQCWAKTAIVKALSILGHDDADVYIKGLRHVQMEAVWGGAEDMAGALRATSVVALTQCRHITDLDVLEYLVEALVDPDKTVRAEAARAIGCIDRREAALILRLRSLTGDSDPEPLAAVFSSLLAIEGARGISFLERFLNDSGDAGQEAALALGSTHSPAALQILRSALKRCMDPALRPTLLSAIALTRLPEAFEFLIGEFEAGSRAAFDALSAMPLSDDQRARIDRIRS